MLKTLLGFLAFVLLISLPDAYSQIAGNWKLTGPNAFPKNVSGQINGIGRVCQLVFDPVNENRIYAASASGGLWVSNDQSVTWKEVGTDELPYSQCASICIDYTDNNIIYLGTGDPNYYGNAIGVWKTTDGGQTWSPSNTGIGLRMALEILMDPNDHNILIAATNDGIWKTYDGGVTWIEKLIDGAFTDMKFQPKPGSNVIYAVTWSAYFRSDDMGETWTQINNGVFIPGGNGNGLRLAVSPADPEKVYIGMIAGEGTILKSVDAGLSFATVKYNPDLSLVGYSADESGQGNYNFSMTADPDNANIVYVVAHVVWMSTDGGINWTQLGDWWADCHTDMHDIEVAPFDHTKLFNANDGGIFISTDGGDNWEPASDGLAATECYHAATSQIREDLVSIGTQDNGELYFSDDSWKTNRGGDWGPTEAFDHQSDDYVYYIGAGTRRHLFGGGDQNIDFPFPADNTVQLAFNPQVKNVAFTGKKNLYRTDGLSDDPPTWIEIYTSFSSVKAIASSPANPNKFYAVYSNLSVLRSDNALDSNPSFTTFTAPSPTGTAASIVVLKNKPEVVYLSCGGKVFRSGDEGVTWTDITFNLPSINIIRILSDDYSNDESVYVGTAKGVYFKNDTMTSWLNYSQGLPTIADITDFMMFNDGTSCSRLRVSYYGRGVWESSLNRAESPQSVFSANYTEICPGSVVQFTDESCGTPDSWSWTFEGGTPSTSTDQNPVITYNTQGTFSVTMIASNSNGSSTTTQTSLVNVAGTIALPLSEGFEGNQFLPLFWTMFDANNDQVVWKWSDFTGAYGNSDHSVYFDNYNYDAGGSRDEVRTPKYNFTGLTSAILTFDHAYAKYDATYFDTLAVLVSLDCGVSSTEVWVKGYSDLATAPDHTNFFIPTSGEWASNTIDLTPFLGEPNVMIMFQSRGHYGNELYVDNVNIQATSDVAPQAAFTADHFSSCPDMPIHFTDQSTGLPDSWSWLFPGGSPSASSLQNPDVSYSTPGTYDVTLTATNSFGNSSATYTGFITILNPPLPPVITVSGFDLTSSLATSYQWYLNGNIISGATNQAYTVNQNGDYTVMIWDQNGCFATSDPFTVTGTGISESFAGGYINVFPNPAKGEFYVSLINPYQGNYSFEIFNSLGQKVYSRSMEIVSGDHLESIDLGTTGKGAYFLTVYSDVHRLMKKILIE